MANQVPVLPAPHVLPSQAPRACYGLAAVTLGGAYAAVPARHVSLAPLNEKSRREITFDGGTWGLVRLPGTGCARRGIKPAVGDPIGVASGCLLELAIRERSVAAPGAAEAFQPRATTPPKGFDL
ncbi:MAG: hypothetical protein EPN70_19515 [Paraburkholderia sp.]|nr:MAG: hypothetical protein EPN70_19515 [Paraburkholderia sp.]TAM30125.1 MAG: hypothetical protein EPN59_09705 [Paraburkholderia sp.]